LLLQVNFAVPNLKEDELFSVRTNITICVSPQNVLEEGSKNASRNVFNVKYIKVKVKIKQSHYKPGQTHRIQGG
jgi:hypothetical protein